MIVISLLGVDQYQAASFVSDIQDEVAQIFETDPEEIVFYAPDSFLIYRGVDQTSYQLDVVVQCPQKYMPLESRISEYLIKVFTQTHVHVRILFEYFDPAHEHESINEEYPRFMTNENMAHFEAESDEEDPEKTEPYTGNPFAEYDERVKAKEQEQTDEALNKKKAAKKD